MPERVYSGFAAPSADCVGARGCDAPAEEYDVNEKVWDMLPDGGVCRIQELYGGLKTHTNCNFVEAATMSHSEAVREAR